MTEWISAIERLPDADTSVLIAMDDGEVWTGFLDDDRWRYISGDPIDCIVTHWMDFPEPPK